MMDLPLTTFVIFAVLLLVLAWMSRQVGLLIQEIVLRLTGSIDLAVVILFLVYLPGIIIHEVAHWLMAKLLGLKTGKFRVWPRKRGKQIGMGSVSVARGGPLADSLVGLAPLIVGSLLVASVGMQVFQSNQMIQLLQQGSWRSAITTTLTTMRLQPDGFVWLYLLFAVANAMLPSSSDREPLRSLLLYILVFGVLYLFIDNSGQIFLQLANWLTGPVETLVSALALVTLLDAIILAVLYLLRTALAILHPQILS